MSANPEPDKSIRVGDFGAARRAFAALEDDEQTDSDQPAIPGYTVHGVIGAGGGGTVYRGTHDGSARAVAIKLLSSRLGSTAGSQRAWRELDVLSQLHLPCLPRLLDYGEHDGRLFMVTELVEGLTLERHCDQMLPDRRRRVELLARVADAVQLVHERGVIHRDVKPSNIIIDPNGDPVLIDFGIAALAAEDFAETLTAAGTPLGSPSFMAPEQARGERAAVSTRTDVYGLGATAYQILLGQTPFDLHATLHEAIRRIAQESPREPREIDDAFPRPLAAVLHKAVARCPERRYPTAAAFAADLRRWLNREPVEARPLSLFRRVLRTLGRHPVASTLGLCAALLGTSLAGAVLVSLWWSVRPHSVRHNGEEGAKGEAQLLTAGRRVLKTWGPCATDAHDRLIALRDEKGTHRLAIVGFDWSASEPDCRGMLCAFDVDRNPDQPYWARGITDDQIPASLLPPEGKCSASEFGVRLLDVQDYFPDRPGLEIMAVFVHSLYSPRAVRIYDLGGGLLYQFWHDGALGRAYWMSGPGLLILAGVNSEVVTGRTVGWASRDPESFGDPAHPSVVFALRPREGRLSREMLVADDAVDSDVNEIAWYRCLPRTEGPGDSGAVWRIEQPQSGGDRAGRLSLRVGPVGDRIGISWDIDEFGREIPRTRIPDDAFRAAWKSKKLAHPAEFWHLQSLPPLLSPELPEPDPQPAPDPQPEPDTPQP